MGIHLFGDILSSSSGVGVGFMTLMSTILTGAFGVTLLFFLGFHVKLICAGQTTLEVTFAHDNNPFDNGRRRNWEAVFGKNPWLWFLPVNTLESSGYELDFPPNSDARTLLSNNPNFDPESGRPQNNGSSQSLSIAQQTGLTSESPASSDIHLDPVAQFSFSGENFHHEHDNEHSTLLTHSIGGRIEGAEG